MKLQNILDAALDLIYPPDLYCICCGKIIDSSRTYRLCNECFDEMKWIDGRTCIRCGKQLSQNNPYDICYNCREHEHVFDMGYTCCEYGQLARAVIFALKYKGRTDIARTIGEILHDRANASREELKYDFVVPVPVHMERLRTRGYNQAGIIASEFARLENASVRDILVRTGETVAMKGLTPLERAANIQGAFAIDPHLQDAFELIKGRSILIIDDIYTTGATIDEIARVLKEAGASSVIFLTFAAGADMIKSE